MPDYKQLYVTLMQSTEKAIRELIAAQQTCEELYLASCEAEDKERQTEEKADIVKMKKE